MQKAMITCILRNRVGYHLTDSLQGGERREGYYQVISYEIEKDNCIIIPLSKESKPRPKLRLKFDNHIVNIRP